MNQPEHIRFCEVDQIPQLQKFIHDFWKSDHILSKNTELLKFQHLDPITGKINFVVAVNESGEFTCILGFIPNYQYDASLKKDLGNSIWLAIWKRSPQASKGIGMKLYEFLISHFNPVSVAAIGINDQIKETYKSLGFSTGQLDHYYFFRNWSKIASYSNSGNFLITEICRLGHSVDYNEKYGKQIQNPSRIPQKSWAYFINRYQKHPIYKYKFYGVFKDSKLMDIMVCRINYVKHPQASCMRIVDVFNNFCSCGDLTSALNKILTTEQCEYIDMLRYSSDYTNFGDIGMDYVNGQIIIPNYFEPFDATRKTIEFAHKTTETKMPFVIYKGDSDQDRPNLIDNG